MTKKYYAIAMLFLVLPSLSCTMWRSVSLLNKFGRSLSVAQSPVLLLRTMTTVDKQHDKISKKIARLREDLSTPERGKKQKQKIEKLWNLYEKRAQLEAKINSNTQSGAY